MEYNKPGSRIQGVEKGINLTTKPKTSQEQDKILVTRDKKENVRINVRKSIDPAYKQTQYFGEDEIK
jgi:hypothetical protein